MIDFDELERSMGAKSIKAAYTPGMACVRQAGAWWNVSVLLNGSKHTIVCPSFKSELDAKNFVSYYYPNCMTFISHADMLVEIEYRRQEDGGWK